MKGWPGALEENLHETQRRFTVSLSPVLPQSDLQPFFCKGNCTLGKGTINNQTFWGLLDTASERRLIPGDPKKHCGLPVKAEGYGGQVINGVWAEVRLTVGPVCLELILCCFSSSRMYNCVR